MKCPACGAMYRSRQPFSPLCRRCGADLTMLIELQDAVVTSHRRAIAALEAEDYDGAIAAVQQGLRLHPHHADLQALAGQVRALQGQWAEAVRHWQTTQAIAPNHPQATQALGYLRRLAEREAESANGSP